MWKQLYEFFTKVVTLAHRTDKLEQVIKDQQQELKELATLAQRLAYELRRTNERENSEREKLLLKVENMLLKSGRQLPPAPDDDAKK